MNPQPRDRAGRFGTVTRYEADVTPSSPSPLTAEADISTYLTAGGAASWAAIDELASQIGNSNWSIGGGQMVTIHASRHHATRFRATADADVVVDVRAGGRRAMAEVAGCLTSIGFDMTLSATGVSKFRRGDAQVDLLAPDGLNGRVKTFGGGFAVQAPGGTQALHRSRPLAVRWLANSTTEVRCPTLLGAIIAKAAAATEIVSETDDRRLRHQEDLVLLLSLATLEQVPLEEITKKDRRRITAGARPLLANPHHRAWGMAEHPSDVVEMIRRLTS
jgi:hypothetical protein